MYSSYNVCEGVDAYNAARPPPSYNLVVGQATIFTIMVVLLVLSMPFAYSLREHARFSKVRPFAYTLAWGICLIMWVAAATLPSITSTFPCALQAFLFCFSLNFFATNTVMKGIILTVETLYAKRAMAEKTILSDESSFSINSHTVTVRGRIVKFAAMIKTLALVGMGTITPDSLALQDLQTAKISYLYTGVVLTIPAMICFIVLMVAFPPLAQCDCRDGVFLELLIALMIALSIEVSIAMRAIFVAWKVSGGKFDRAGIMIEVVGVVFIPALLAMIIWVLVALDPGNVAYNRQISWFYGVILSASGYWWVTLGAQFLAVYRSLHSAKGLLRNGIALQVPPLEETLLKNETIREEFQRFAELHLVTESVLFLEDVGRFKTYFSEKDGRWRRQKAKHIAGTYVQPGALLEINVSYTARMECMKKVATIKDKEGGGGRTGDGLELFDLFTLCENEVVDMLTNGAWREFFLWRRRRESKDSVGSAIVQAV